MLDGHERIKSAIELSEEQIRTAMKNPAHLKEWAVSSGRRWLVFNAAHLVDALPFPHGVEALMQVVACYRDHRAGIDTGETQLVENPITDTMHEIPIYHPETLTLTERDRAIRWLIGEITNLDSDWRLSDRPL